MIKMRGILKGSLAVLGLFILILDSECVVYSARDGISLCLQSVFPSLFPFIYLSNILVAALVSRREVNPTKDRIGILLVGYLGGYPVGAQCAVQAYRNHQLSLQEAQRLAICCNNPGPAFIFAIAAPLFTQAWVPWGLWGIHLLSSLLPFWLIPSAPKGSANESISFSNNPPPALISALRSMTLICGWVILFRVIISILHRWVLWLVSQEWSIVLCGFLEMTNGCLELKNLDCIGLRFMLCALFLSFGGCCTVIQTHDLTKGLRCRGYLRCKLLEGGCSFILAYFIQALMMPKVKQFQLSPLFLVGIAGILSIIALSIRKTKNNSRILTFVGV